MDCKERRRPSENFNSLADMLHKILRRFEQVPQESSSSFQLDRVILASDYWLHVSIECFVPRPPLVAVRE